MKEKSNFTGDITLERVLPREVSPTPGFIPIEVVSRDELEKLYPGRKK